MATVSIPISFAVLAITGAAPVPVPPPIPAVIKTMLVLLDNTSLILSMLSMAACLPISDLLPAPLPSVSTSPSCNFTATGLLCKAWASVLHTTKFTSWIPFLYIWFTALLPPPPTPITLIWDDRSGGRSKFIKSSMVFILVHFRISLIKYNFQGGFHLVQDIGLLLINLLFNLLFNWLLLFIFQRFLNLHLLILLIIVLQTL